MTTAKVIADSISPDGVRLTTIEVTFHRFVLAEFNTHRVFSRNSASSRAIPFKKQARRVWKDPALPVVWAGEQKGMQGGDEIDAWKRPIAKALWLGARTTTLGFAKGLARLGVHKSLVNRLLEPWMWHTVIVTATDWDGFWEQRCSPLAQPEIRVAAEAMRAAYDESRPKHLNWGEWHLPYIDGDTVMQAVIHCFTLMPKLTMIELLCRISVARCARVSYLTHDGKRDIKADLALYDRLVTARPMHASPLEHVARPERLSSPGNFRGWAQLRHEVEEALVA